MTETEVARIERDERAGGATVRDNRWSAIL